MAGNIANVYLTMCKEVKEKSKGLLTQVEKEWFLGIEFRCADPYKHKLERYHVQRLNLLHKKYCQRDTPRELRDWTNRWDSEREDHEERLASLRGNEDMEDAR